MKKLYEFYLDCGRMGDLDGLFVATEKEVKDLIGKEIYFGEVLGKHSDICEPLEKEHLKVISEDQEKIEWLIEVLGNNGDGFYSSQDHNTYTISGFNPFDYYEELDEEEV